VVIAMTAAGTINASMRYRRFRAGAGGFASRDAVVSDLAGAISAGGHAQSRLGGVE
jgi:hypothetical protein